MIGRGIEVVCGCMFSGKTEELLRRLRRVTLAKQQIALFKPAIDDRYSETEVVSHSNYRMSATTIPTSDPWRMTEHWKKHGRPATVGIDEGQFFEDLPALAEWFSKEGSRVIVAGLDLDYRGEPFLDPRILSIAGDVSKLMAVCMKCGAPASRTQRISGGGERIEVGAADKYEARCLAHWSGKSTG